MDEKIDLVITWVDGNDPKWLSERKQYSKDNKKNQVRFRDYETIKYLFRSIDMYATWVNKIFFVTYGHLPKWLNINNEKLVIVRHSDFIPEEYLPTFNSCTIELNFHRIKGLSNNFIYCNDDTLFINKTKQTDFFKNGKLCDLLALNMILPNGRDNFEHRLVNNSNLLNRNFNLIESFKKHPFKWINFKYGIDCFRTIMLLPGKKISTFKNYHGIMGLNTEVYNMLWIKEQNIMNVSCVDKFRSFYGVNPWIIYQWKLMEGEFYPRSRKFNIYYSLKDDNTILKKLLYKKSSKTICINDSKEINDFDRTKSQLISILEEKYPNKSSFEL